jgi:cohesin complex subunit SA-1/2
MITRRNPLMDISNSDVTSTPVATGSRRKSGRAVKAPEKFVPDLPSSQQGSTSAKRKRGDEDVENDASDIEEEEDDDEVSDGTDSAAEEEAKEALKKAKAQRKPLPAAKKPKINGTVSHDEAPALKLPSRLKKAKKVAIADRDAEGLYGKRVYSQIVENLLIMG